MIFKSIFHPRFCYSKQIIKITSGFSDLKDEKRLDITIVLLFFPTKFCIHNFSGSGTSLPNLSQQALKETKTAGKRFSAGIFNIGRNEKNPLCTAVFIFFFRFYNYFRLKIKNAIFLLMWKSKLSRHLILLRR